MNKLYIFTILFLVVMGGQQVHAASIVEKSMEAVDSVAEKSRVLLLKFFDFIGMKKVHYCLVKLCPTTRVLLQKGFVPCSVYALLIGLTGAGFSKFTNYKQAGQICSTASTIAVAGFCGLGCLGFLAEIADDFELDH